MNTQDKVWSVESIRGIACLMVVLSHLSLTFFPYLHSFYGLGDPNTNEIQHFIHQSPFGFFFSGTSAVFIFFVLSGYILSKVALKEGNSPEKIFSMCLKRYPRLMIPVLASCLIGFSFFLIFDISKANLFSWIGTYSGHNASFVGALYSGAVEVFLVSGNSIYNPVLWTMKIELIGSFIVYALCLNRMTLKIPLLSGVAFGITAYLTYTGKIWTDLGLGLLSFYIGYLFSLYGKNISYKTALAILAIGLYLAGAHNTSASYSYIHGFLGYKTYNLCNFASGFLIVYAIIFNEKINSAFSGRLPVFMGKVSFSVYLIHMPILSTFGVLSFNLIFNATGIYTLSAVFAALLTIFAVYFFAVFFYRAIDSQGVALSNLFANYIITQFKKCLPRKA